MLASPERERLWVVPRRIVDDHVGFAFILWLVSLVVLAGIIGGIAHFNTITGSVWDHFASSTPHIFAAFMCGYVAHTFLPAYITHGYTRREFAAQSTIFVGLFALAVTAMIVVGYLLEYLAFGLIGWPRDITNDHIFTSSTQVHLIGFEFGVTYLAWSLVGFFIGACFYRSDDTGWFSIAVALVPISLSAWRLTATSGHSLSQGASSTYCRRSRTGSRSFLESWELSWRGCCRGW